MDEWCYNGTAEHIWSSPDHSKETPNTQRPVTDARNEVTTLLALITQAPVTSVCYMKFVTTDIVSMDGL